MEVRYKIIDSPVGSLWIAATELGLRALGFVGQERGAQVHNSWVQDSLLQDPIEDQLQAYFAGDLQQFDRALDLRGTEFQLQVWSQLQCIPYGNTTSYGKIAQQIGHAKAARAVGAANGMNPIAIVIPCHRVVGSSGKLTGFAGGLANKSKLLQLEQATAGAQLGLDFS